MNNKAKDVKRGQLPYSTSKCYEQMIRVQIWDSRIYNLIREDFQYQRTTPILVLSVTVHPPKTPQQTQTNTGRLVDFTCFERVKLPHELIPFIMSNGQQFGISFSPLNPYIILKYSEVDFLLL